jgi:hypothetical protein
MLPSKLQRQRRRQPEAGLILDAAGNLYGTTFFGDLRLWHGVRSDALAEP